MCSCILISWIGVVSRVFFQAEDGIRDLVRSRGLGDVYKRQEEVGRSRVFQFCSGGSVASRDRGIR